MWTCIPSISVLRTSHRIGWKQMFNSCIPSPYPNQITGHHSFRGHGIISFACQKIWRKAKLSRTVIYVHHLPKNFPDRADLYDFLCLLPTRFVVSVAAFTPLLLRYSAVENRFSQCRCWCATWLMFFLWSRLFVHTSDAFARIHDYPSYALWGFIASRARSNHQSSALSCPCVRIRHIYICTSSTVGQQHTECY